MLTKFACSAIIYFFDLLLQDFDLDKIVVLAAWVWDGLIKSWFLIQFC
jgi:hypothetical protein